jgi:hypothetical protein
VLVILDISDRVLVEVPVFVGVGVFVMLKVPV